MNWKIKKFHELSTKELYNILYLRTEVFIVEQNCAYQDCDYKDHKSYHVFCEENGEILAYLRILEKGVSYDEISIGRVLVNKHNRGKGLAREMMVTAMNFIKDELKEDNIRISAQEYLKDFYKNLGFMEVSEVYLEDNIPHIEMLY